jgi:hypothetical protein
MPNPMKPLTRKIKNASPDNPPPHPCAQIPRNTIAQLILQKLASTPPRSRAIRCAVTAETENRIVVKNAGNIRPECVRPEPLVTQLTHPTHDNLLLHLQQKVVVPKQTRSTLPFGFAGVMSSL